LPRVFWSLRIRGPEAPESRSSAALWEARFFHSPPILFHPLTTEFSMSRDRDIQLTASLWGIPVEALKDRWTGKPDLAKEAKENAEKAEKAAPGGHPQMEGAG